MSVPKVNFEILQGATFRRAFYRYDGDVEVVKPITGVTRGYPTLITAVAHGLPNTSQAPVAFMDAQWLTSVDANNAATTLAKFRQYAKWVDADTLSIKVDSTAQAAYTATAGKLFYNPPIDMSAPGWMARMQIRASVASAIVIAEFTTEDGHMTLAADGKIDLYLLDTITDALTFASGVYDLEVVDPATSDVTRVVTGVVTLNKQITRTP